MTGPPFSYSVLPNITYNGHLVSDTSIAISFDCLDCLGGDEDAALIRVFSVPDENSGIQAWHSQIIIDALVKGVPIGEFKLNSTLNIDERNLSCCSNLKNRS